jgi:lipopolysaccharide transport system permease protein
MADLERSGVGPVVREPVGQRLARTRDLIVALTRADLRVRYSRGPFRFVKWLLDPFALLGVYLVLVTFVFDNPGEAPGLSLACAVVPFQLVMTTVVSSTNAITLRESVILNMRFDRMLIPPSTVATETVAFLASLSLIVGTMIVYGVAPTAAILFYPVVLLLNILLALAVAFPISLIGLWFRELRVFVVSFARAMFFLAPGLVPLSEASETAQTWLRLNPLTGLFESYRAVFLFGEVPQLDDLLYPALFSLVLLVLAVPIYRREQGQFAKVVE